MDQTTPTQTSAPLQPSPVQPNVEHVDIHASKSRSYTSLFVVLLVLCIGIIGALFYQNQTLKQQAINSKTTPTQEVTETPLESPPVEPTAIMIKRDNWKTYTNPVRHYAIQYPTAWKLDSSKAETKLENDFGATLTLTKGSYAITIQWPSAYGPGICLFDDQPRVEDPGMITYCKGAYIEFSSVDNSTTYRHLVTPESQKDHVQWEVYTKNKDAFVTVPPTRFIAPLTYDQTSIEEMNQILATLTFKNAIQTDVTRWKIYPSSSTIGLPYEFKYPAEFNIAEAQDRVIFTFGTSEFIHRWMGKTKDLTALLDTYQEFGAPNITFSSRKTVNFGEYTGVKALASDNASVYYFLGNPSLNGFLVFIYDTDNSEVEKIIPQIVSTIVIK